MVAKNALYVTTSSIGHGAGGSIVAFHEACALTKWAGQALVWDRIKILDSGDVPHRLLDEPVDPFLWDYLALDMVEDLKVKLAHFFGNPFGKTAKKLKNDGAKIVVTVPAHNLETSLEEFRRLNILYPYSHMTDPFLWTLYTRHIVNADIVVCPSKMSADYITWKLGLKNRVAVIPHGCDLPETVKPIPDEFKAAYLGQYGPDKGVTYLIQAWELLNYRDASLIVAGGPALQVPGSRAKYEFPGYVKDIGTIYDACSAYVQPSISEGFGLEVLEAMSRGRPVIVSEGAGASEIVEDGVDGYVVPIRDPEAIADKIRLLKNSPELVVDMGKRAREKAEKYIWNMIEDKYVELYAEVVA